jgi:hypothetical protein
VLAGICFGAKPIMASPMVRALLRPRLAWQIRARCSRYDLALPLLVPGVLANHA